MRYLRRFSALLAVLLLLASPALAHSGRTDSQGGHYNRRTGEYHFHHGYPAHQHPNGVCPYKSNTKSDSSSDSGTHRISDDSPVIVLATFALMGVSWFILDKLVERDKRYKK